MSRKTSVGLMLIVLLATAHRAAHAAILTYDANTGSSGAQDGAGLGWNTTNVNFWDGATDVAWPNTTADEAIFGAGSGAAGTVAVGTVNANKITFNAPGSGNYTLSGGTITLGGTTPTITTNVNATISSILAGVGVSLTKTGAGTLTLNTATNTYSGGTTISQGTLIISGANSAPATGTITLGDGNTGASNVQFTANNFAFNSSARNVTVANAPGFTGTATIALTTQNQALNGTITLNRPTTITSSAAAGGAYVNYQGGAKITGNVGTLTLQSTAAGALYVGNSGVNDFVGAVRIPQGSVFTFSASALGTTNPVVMSGTARLGLFGNALTIGALTGAAGNIIDPAAGGTKTLTISSASDAVYAGVIKNNGAIVMSLTKSGGGTQTLTGANTYTGATTISGGTLLVNGTKSGLGTVTVANNATLGGTGVISGAVTIQSGGTLSPGASPGTITFTNDLTIAPGAAYAFEDGDLTNILGQLALGDSSLANWTLRIGAGFLDGGSIVLFNYGTLAGNFDLTPTFDLSNMDFSPSGSLSLINDTVNKRILLFGIHTAVPEPTAAVLLAIGVLLGAPVLWRKKRTLRGQVDHGSAAE